MLIENRHPMLKQLIHAAKKTFFYSARSSGISSLLLASNWRRSRLLILCYHGVSLADEHLWEPGMYIAPTLLRARLQTLKDTRCNVLPLGEAVERLYSGDLPPRAVAITFDDGFYDFYALAWPLVKEFSFPATVYLTTYYCEHQEPVFDLASRYLLWRSEGSFLEWPGMLPAPVRLDAQGRSAADKTMKEHCLRRNISGAEKAVLIAELAERLKIDLNEIRNRRILHLMTPDEVSAVANQGADVELHMHRHRVSRMRDRFWQELDENRSRIESWTGHKPTHFCYPGGFWLDGFPQWLKQRGVVSATTCDTGMASADHDRFYLPRVLDTNLDNALFDGWLSGTAELISRHAINKSEGQLLEAIPG